MTLGEAFGLVAPYYNLAFVVIVIVLFIYLLKTKSKGYTKPWLILFIAICVFIVEEVMTVLRSLGIVSFPPFIFGVFEVLIISLFIYMLLLQKQFIKTGKRG